MLPAWRPTLGAWAEPGGIRFRVWAPDASAVRVVFDPPGPEVVSLETFADGTFGPAFPEPASRFQPRGVHGPCEIVDPHRFTWTDRDWTGISHNDPVLYELLVGTFTAEGTFAAAAQRLPYMSRLGTAVELMRVGDFPGDRN